VVVIRDLDVVDTEKIDSMQFRYSGTKIIGSHFGPEAIRSEGKVVGNDWNQGGSVYNTFESTLQEGLVVKVEILHSGYPSWDWKTITWEGERVISIFEGFRGRKAHRQIVYSNSGKVAEDLDLSKPVKRKPLPKGVTMKSLEKVIRLRLAKAVVTAVTKAKVKVPVYCVALNYDSEGNPLLLPELGIGLERERQARLKRDGRKAKHSIWEPEEFSLYANNRTSINDKELERACDLYNRELQYDGSYTPARKLILQVAADLAKVDWTGRISTTDDFIVYAVDTDGMDLHKNLKVSVSPKLLSKLKASKLL
jgi:hypothetical protein